MQVVTDSACDLTSEQIKQFNIHVMPMLLTLEGKSYRSGVDIQPSEFYALLGQTEAFPSTSQPSAGEFADLYRQVAQIEPEIFSIHISGGLSGTLDAARAGAAMVPEAKVTFFDTMTLSCPEGWMVMAVVQALAAGWPMDRLFELLERMQKRTQGLFTLNTLKYLIHGGRISHLRGLMASMLNIKPIIGPEKEHGKYESFAQDVTWRRVMNRFPDVVCRMFSEGQKLRVQLLHGNNLEGVEMLREAMVKRFQCQFDPVAVVAPVLGAHTGPSVVGLAVGDPDIFEGLF
jgi:DegV family protein with EDD domain